MSHNWENKIVWITGASTGIGRALTLDLLALGATVIGSARNESQLNTVSNVDNYLPYPVDITDSEALNQVVEFIDEKCGRLDVLIANAGICEYIDMPNFDIAVMEKVMHINYTGTIRTIAAALPLLRHSEAPYLLAMSSSNAYVGLPRSQAYGPSKAAIYNLMQSMKADFAGTIDVSVICPGFVESPLTDLNDFPMPAIITAQEASAYILKGMKKRNFDINFPKRFTVIMRIMSCLPNFILYKLTTKLSRKQA